MTEGFPEWSSVERDLLVLPIRNVAGVTHEYVIEPPGYLDMERISRSQAAARTAIDNDLVVDDDASPEVVTDEEFLSMMLGPALEKMRADNVPRIAITHAAAVAHTDATFGREASLYIWTRGLNSRALAAELEAIREAVTPDEQPANRAERRAAAKSAPKPPSRPSPTAAAVSS